MRAHALGDSMFVPILLGAAGNMEPENDQISVEVSESIGDCDDLILIPDSPSGLEAVGIHVVKDLLQTLVGRYACAINV